MFDGVLYQLGGALQTERLHYTVPVKFDRSRRHMQYLRDFLGIPSFGDQLQHFALPGRQLGCLSRTLAPFDTGFQRSRVYGWR